ncbi:MAG: flavin reductase family protein [Chloroflexota bacterium]
MYDREAMRIAMRQWTTGVTVVSAASGQAQHGMTVNSFTSISLDPPLLLVSLARSARTHALVEASQAFGVTILNAAQQDISDRFAGRTGDDEDRFNGLATLTLFSGAPFIDGGLAFFDCQVVNAFPVGDHTLFVGQVTALWTPQAERLLDQLPLAREPLLYYNREYRRLAGGL